MTARRVVARRLLRARRSALPSLPETPSADREPASLKRAYVLRYVFAPAANGTRQERRVDRQRSEPHVLIRANPSGRHYGHKTHALDCPWASSGHTGAYVATPVSKVPPKMGRCLALRRRSVTAAAAVRDVGRSQRSAEITP